MSPTFRDGDLLLALTRFFNIRVGAIIVFEMTVEYEKIRFVKRVSSLTKDNPPQIHFLGDNLRASSSSMNLGTISYDDVAGLVVLQIQPRFKPLWLYRRLSLNA